MITNTRKYIKKNSVENFKYDAIYLYDTYQAFINEALATKIPIFGLQDGIQNCTFSDDVKECRKQFAELRNAGMERFQEKSQFKIKIRNFLDKQNAIKDAFIQAEYQIFGPLSKESLLQQRKHSCNMIFYNNVLKCRQVIINYFGIDFVDEEYNDLQDE